MIVKKIIVDERPKYCYDCPIMWSNTKNKAICSKWVKEHFGSFRVPDERCLCEIESEVKT